MTSSSSYSPNEKRFSLYSTVHKKCLGYAFVYVPQECWVPNDLAVPNNRLSNGMRANH